MTVLDDGPNDPEPGRRDRTAFLIWLGLGVLWVGVVLLCIATRGVTR